MFPVGLDRWIDCLRTKLELRARYTGSLFPAVFGGSTGLGELGMALLPKELLDLLEGTLLIEATDKLPVVVPGLSNFLLSTEPTELIW